MSSVAGRPSEFSTRILEGKKGVFGSRFGSSLSRHSRLSGGSYFYMIISCISLGVIKAGWQGEEKASPIKVIMVLLPGCDCFDAWMELIRAFTNQRMREMSPYHTV